MTTEDDTEKVWLRSDYRIGDVLVFQPQMVHAGLPNVSNSYRISADLRYQHRGDPMPWQARHRLF